MVQIALVASELASSMFVCAVLVASAWSASWSATTAP